MTTDLTPDEVIFMAKYPHEVAVKKYFGVPLTKLKDDEATLFRAAMFIDLMRNHGKSPAAAFAEVSDTELGDIVPRDGHRSYFPTPEPDELDPENPDTEAGKDSSPTD